MRKTAALLLALSLFLSMTACSAESEKKENIPASVPAAQTPFPGATAEEAYARVLIERAPYACWRCDLNGDGETELILGFGESEASKMLEFYAYDGTGAVQVGEMGGSHRVLYRNLRDGGLVVHYGHMGVESVEYVGMLAGRLVITTAVEEHEAPNGYTREFFWGALPDGLHPGPSAAETDEALRRFAQTQTFGGDPALLRCWLCDLDGDGRNELIVRTANYEADAMLHLYVLSAGEAVQVGELPGAHSKVYENTRDGGITVFYGHMGAEHAVNVRLVGDVPVTQTAFEVREATGGYTVLENWRELPDCRE